MQSSKETPKRTPTATPKSTPAEVTVKSLLTGLGPEEVVDQLVNLKYRDPEHPDDFVYTDTPILSVKRLDIIMEVISMIHHIGFEDTIDFLQSIFTPEQLFWDQPDLEEARNKLQREITIMQTPEVGVEGFGTCKHCGSKELVFASVQRGGGDEALHTFRRCVTCQKNT